MKVLLKIINMMEMEHYFTKKEIKYIIKEVLKMDFLLMVYYMIQIKIKYMKANIKMTFLKREKI